jgi:hypothetical protein
MITRVDKLGRRTPVKVVWSDWTLNSMLNIAEEQGLLEQLREKGECVLKQDAKLLEILGEEYEPEYRVLTRHRKLRAGTILEMWRAW